MPSPKTIHYAVTKEVHPHLLEAVLKLIPSDFKCLRVKDKNADYIFHSANSLEVLKYSGIRISVTGENVSPDFNISDYAIGFDPLLFQDRYCRLPLIKLYRDAYACFLQDRPSPESILAEKKGFCAYVMSNTKNSAEIRTHLFEALNRYKPVASGGKWNNTVGGPVVDKLAFQSKYKFVLALENASHPGYLTEKFAEAAQSNAIPIYWGDPTIAKDFNEKAFINCHAFPSLNAVVNHVQAIDQNDNHYLEMLAEPWFVDGKEPEHYTDAYFQTFFRSIFEQAKEFAYRRNRSRWGKKYEKHLKTFLRLNKYF